MQKSDCNVQFRFPPLSAHFLHPSVTSSTQFPPPRLAAQLPPQHRSCPLHPSTPVVSVQASPHPQSSFPCSFSPSHPLPLSWLTGRAQCAHGTGFHQVDGVPPAPFGQVIFYDAKNVLGEDSVCTERPHVNGSTAPAAAKHRAWEGKQSLLELSSRWMWSHGWDAARGRGSTAAGCAVSSGLRMDSPGRWPLSWKDAAPRLSQLWVCGCMGQD